MNMADSVDHDCFKISRSLDSAFMEWVRDKKCLNNTSYIYNLEKNLSDFLLESSDGDWIFSFGLELKRKCVLNLEQGFLDPRLSRRVAG